MQRRTTLLALTTGLTLAITPSVTAAAQSSSGTAIGDRLEAAPETLRTPFEKSNGARWTSFDEWRQFWAALDRSSERVGVSRAGSSGQGRPIDLVSIGAPAPRSRQEAAKGSVVLYNCSIHGDEPSGWDACMTLGRDLATSKDPLVKRFLTTTTVLLTDINPDGWVANTRTNAANIDVNRDFMALKSSEARTLAKVIRDYRPDVLNDLHEYGPSEFYNTQALTLWPRNRNVDNTIHDLAKTMVEDYAAARIESEGMTNGVYGLLVKDGKPFRQVAGDGQGRILRNYSGLKHVVGQLTEAANEPVTDAEKKDAALTNRRRVAVQYASATGSAEFMVEHGARIANAIDQAAREATRMGAAREGVVYFAGQDDMVPTKETEVEPHPMCGYRLTAAQAKDLHSTLRLHDITMQQRANGAWVPLGQPMRGLIPLLLDARSEFRIAEATPVADCPS